MAVSKSEIDKYVNKIEGRLNSAHEVFYYLWREIIVTAFILHHIVLIFDLREI